MNDFIEKKRKIKARSPNLGGHSNRNNNRGATQCTTGGVAFEEGAKGVAYS